MLETIKSPTDIKALDDNGIKALSAEIRETIIDTVSESGGHLASNLGFVEPTVVIHQVFDSPNDAILFDVGHQAYTHKLLTGRYDRFPTIRQYGGLSGFTNKDESVHDRLYAGHSGTALASAMGIAEANRLTGSGNYAVCVIGDGSMTNGMAYEALNNCAGKKIDLVIVLNDNEMSISSNVGGISRHLSNVRTSKYYFVFKDVMKSVFGRIPLVGKYLVSGARSVKELFKRVFVKYNVFESLGIDYIGPIDAKDTARLRGALIEAKTKHEPCIVHVISKKGDGYLPAETEPQYYHSVGKFDKERGIIPSDKAAFSSEFGRYMTERANTDKKLCAVTAAMSDGTGLGAFAKAHQGRFYDVGIAEEYAVTFSAALAGEGFSPVCALYSTFAQRVYDQLWHDAALQKSPLVLALDRAGIVPGDGRTHQGIFDVSLFSSVPGLTVYSPETYDEMRAALDTALSKRELAVVRYPKGSEADYDRSGFAETDAGCEYAPDADVLIITYGRITANAKQAADIVSDRTGVPVGILKLTKIAPLDFAAIGKRMAGKKLVYILEEGVKSGSVAERIASYSAEAGIDTNLCIRAIPELFLPCGTTEELMKLTQLDAASVAGEITEIISELNGAIK